MAIEFRIAYHALEYLLWITKPNFIPGRHPFGWLSISSGSLRPIVLNCERIPSCVTNGHIVNLLVDF